MTKPSITIKTSDFAFNKTELTFIRRHLSFKYPSVMNKMMDQTRHVMRVLQTLARGKIKYTYYASRIHPDETERYVVSEMLYGLTEQQLRSIVTIDPIQDRDTPHKDIKTSSEDYRTLVQSLKEALDTKLRLVVYGHVGYKQVIRAVLELLTEVQHDLILQEYSFSISEDQPHLIVNLRHKLNNSHHISLVFDFFELPKNVNLEDQADVVQESEGE